MHHKIMTNKHTVIIGTSFGLVIGLIMSLVSWSLRQHPNTVWTESFFKFHWPVIAPMLRLHDNSYNWKSSAGFVQVALAFSIYWACIGTFLGLGVRTFFNLKNRTRAA
jgi:hypothetical protein